MTGAGPGPLLDRLPRVLLVVGKGGVGKTTCAAGLSFDFAARGDRTLVVTTDPAGTLADLIAPSAARQATLAPVPIGDRLDGWLPDLAGLRRDFLSAWRDVIATIIDRGTYLDREDIDGLVEAALPGADEIFLLLGLGDLIAATDSARYDRIVVDTAPTGHTLRLLELPATFRSVLALLDTMEEKHRFMVRSLTHRYRRDPADDFLDQTRARIIRLTDALSDAAQTAAVLVVRAEPVVIAESARYVDALTSAAITIAVVMINAWTGADAERSGIGTLRSGVATGRGRLDWYTLPRLEPPPQGLVEAGRLLDGATLLPQEKPPTRAARARSDRPAAQGRTPAQHALPPALFPRPLTVIGGKGGVGKTTVACAIAIAAADAGEHVLLVSTDPAPSVADAFGLPVGGEEVAVAGVPRLTARQMDAGAAFARLRDEYRDAIDRVFSAVLSGGLDISHDQEILRNLLAFSPPGIDELYALSILGDALEEGRFTCVIVDPAPTGHLLRLLDMPAVALDWSHRFMRLMLKYKEVAGLGDAAESLLAFARRTRALDERLHDGSRAGMTEVALDEPLVRGEASRLLAAVRARGLHVRALIWNRATGSPSPLPADPVIPQFVSENVTTSLVGVETLRAWSRTWTELVG